MTGAWPAGRRRLLLALLASAAVLAPIAWFWAGSLVPSTYSVMDLGYADFGGGAVDVAHLGHGGHGAHGPGGSPGAGAGVSVATLTGTTDGVPDVVVDLVARKEPFRLASGQRVDGFTLNHTSPGPRITAHQGQLVQVTLVNDSVPDGVSLHWHGVDVPNAEDGVAGVTQDAVPVGGRHVYRFVVPAAGTYWYHSHQVSHTQVRDGLFGALVVLPTTPVPQDVDTVATVHTYQGRRSIDGQVGVRQVDAVPGSRVRVRLVNTDDGPLRVTTLGAPYRVVAVDGHDLTGPTPVTGKVVTIGAGGRYDLEVTTPADGSAVRVDVGGSTYLQVGPPGAAAPPRATVTAELDLLSYGTPAALGFDPSTPDRRFDYDIGRRIGFLDGRPGMWWTVNGHEFPNLPMFVVSEGDVVTMTIKNHSGQVHPMHLHGHHAVVLSRNGVAASGSPWWVDTLNVENGQTYVIAFVADNPGVWMDHCHNLPHATQGLVTHLVYSGVSEPYRVGGESGNSPE